MSTSILSKFHGKPFRWYFKLPYLVVRKVVGHGGSGNGRATPLPVRYGRFVDPEPFWCADEGFRKVYAEMQDLTISEVLGLYMLYLLGGQVRKLPGDVCELGVYRGGSAKLLAEVFLSTGKTIHLFDTFTGLPESKQKWDEIPLKLNSTSLELVKNNLKDYRNIQIHQGCFPETSAPVKDKKFCFVNADMDLFQSTKDACEFFYPRMVPGGVMVFHDYGMLPFPGLKPQDPLCPGVTKAVDDFFADKSEPVICLPSNQAIAIKV